MNRMRQLKMDIFRKCSANDPIYLEDFSDESATSSNKRPKFGHPSGPRSFTVVPQGARPPSPDTESTASTTTFESSEAAVPIAVASIYQPPRKSLLEELQEFQPKNLPEGDFDPNQFKTNPVRRDLFEIQGFKKLWELLEEDITVRIEEIEDSKVIRRGNSNLSNTDTRNQATAQYGRILPDPTDKILKQILEVKTDEVFVDIGHGIGNTVLQAAYTVGCEARGIELVEERHDVAKSLEIALTEARRKISEARDDHFAPVGEIILKHGRLEDPAFREFLTAPDRTVKAFVNNFNGVFADRSAKSKATYVLDDYIAGLFASFQPGSMILTLHPLNMLGACRDEVNMRREKQKLKGPQGRNTDLSSFFDLKKITLGRQNQVASWSQGGSCANMIEVYLYTRLSQGTKNEEPVFRCSNPNCINAKEGTAMLALKKIREKVGNTFETHWVVDSSCTECNIDTSKSTTGRRRKR